MLQDIEQEAGRILSAAQERGVVLRLLGGIAIKMACSSAGHRAVIRKYPDIDMIGLEKQSRDIKKLFADLGYVPRERYNAMHGRTRLIFNDFENNRRVDIFLNIVRMCHEFDFHKRLKISHLTLSPSDLLITKLQIIETNEKDFKDMTALLLDHELIEEDREKGINVKYIEKLCASSWPIYRTFTQTLKNLIVHIDEVDLEEQSKRIAHQRAAKLLDRIELIPKSINWKMRAKVGEKIVWYDLPDRDQQMVDSRTAIDRLMNEKTTANN